MRKKLLIAFLILFACATSVLAAITFQLLPTTGTGTTLLSPNSVSPNAFTAASANYNNLIGGGAGNGYTRCRFLATLAFPSNPGANASVYIWIKESFDGGTTFTDSPTSAITTRIPDVTIPISSGTSVTTMRQTGTGWCPPGVMQIVAQIAGTSVATNSSGNTIAIQPYTIQGN